MTALYEYELPPHRRGYWLSILWWDGTEEMEEKGFVKKDGKKITAYFKLSGFGFCRRWVLTEVCEDSKV